MQLYRTALNAMIAYFITFIYQMLANIYPNKIATFLGFRIHSLISLIIIVVMYLLWVLFFIAFRQEFILPNRYRLQNTIRMVIYVYLAILIYFLLQFLVIFNPAFSLPSWSSHLIILFYWIQALLLLLLFIKLYTEGLSEEQAPLKKPIFLMIIGTLITLILQSRTTFTHYYQLITDKNIKFFAGEIGGNIILVLNSISFLIFIYFLFSVYKEFKPAGSN